MTQQGTAKHPQTSKAHGSRRRSAYIDTVVRTDVVLVQRISLGIQVVGTLAMLFALISAIGIAYNVFSVPGSDVLALSATTCADGTADGQCVAARTGNDTDKPWRCVSGTLVEQSATCGCPTGKFVFGDGSCTLHPQAKFFNFGLSVDKDAAETTFKAQHFDEAFSHTASKALLKQVNPGIKIANYRNFSALTDTEWGSALPTYCAANGCDPETAMLHSQADLSVYTAMDGLTSVQGYNPTGDPLPLCGGGTQSFTASASTLAQSRMVESWKADWRIANFNDPGWLGYNTQAVLSSMTSGGVSADLITSDNGDFYPPGSQLDRTAEYLGICLDQNHPRIQEAFDAQAGMGTALTGLLGRTIPVVPNARSPYWYFHPYFHSGYQSLNSPIQFEVWDSWENKDSPSGGTDRAHYWNVDYAWSKEILRESLTGRKFYLQAQEWYGESTDRGKLYLLADFYLLNNPNLAFMYYDRTSETGPYVQTRRVEDYAWFGAMGYDIGVPTTNSGDLPDVFGNTGSTEHYVFAEGVDPSTPNALTSGATRTYHLYARNYTNALVLVKFREYGGLVGATSATTHALPVHAGGTNVYRPLLAGGTLGDPVTEVTLQGNDARILIPELPPPSCQEQWTCSAWSTCSASQQSRSCTDGNACGTEVSKPAFTQTCSDEPAGPLIDADPPALVGQDCTPNWECSGWSSCSDADLIETRSCVDLNHCPADGEVRTEKRLCGATGGSGDAVPPTTLDVSTASVSYSDTVTVTLEGSDDVTSANALRYYYRLDGQPKRVAPRGSTLTLHDLSNGKHTVMVSAVDEGGNEDPNPVSATFTVKNVLSIVTAPRGKQAPLVKTFDYKGQRRSQFYAFDRTSRWGVSVAVGDVDGDGTGEIVVAPGRGGPPEVRIFTPRGKMVSSFNAYPRSFRGGVNVASADVNGDGRDEVVVAPASGRGPLLRVFLPTGKLLAEKTVFEANFRGGVNVAAGSLESTAQATIIAAPASNGSPVIVQLQLVGERLVELRRSLVLSASRRVGLSLALANVDGRGLPEIIATTTEGRLAPVVITLSASGKRLASFLAASTSFRGGLNVAAGDLQSFNNRAEVATVTSSNGVPSVSLFSPGTDFTASRRLRSFQPYGRKSMGANIAIGHL